MNAAKRQRLMAWGFNPRSEATTMIIVWAIHLARLIQPLPPAPSPKGEGVTSIA